MNKTYQKARRVTHTASRWTTRQGLEIFYTSKYGTVAVLVSPVHFADFSEKTQPVDKV